MKLNKNPKVEYFSTKPSTLFKQNTIDIGSNTINIQAFVKKMILYGMWVKLRKLKV